MKEDDGGQGASESNLRKQPCRSGRVLQCRCSGTGVAVVLWRTFYWILGLLEYNHGSKRSCGWWDKEDFRISGYPLCLWWCRYLLTSQCGSWGHRTTLESRSSFGKQAFCLCTVGKRHHRASPQTLLDWATSSKGLWLWPTYTGWYAPPPSSHFVNILSSLVVTN